MGCTRTTPDDDVLVHEKVPEFCMDFPSAKSGLRELLPGLASVLLLGGLRLKPFVEQIFHALVVVSAGGRRAVVWERRETRRRRRAAEQSRPHGTIFC